MTLLFQGLALVALVVASVSWLSWVRDTWRPIRFPEHLASIDLHGVPDAAAASASRSIGVGIVGQLGEHKRQVDYINRTAASAADSNTLHAMIRVSQPAPELIRAPDAPSEALDISVQFAGSKVDATGLQKLFRTGKRRGGLALSVFLNSADNTTYTGLVSANFKEDSAYGFSLPVQGTMREITEQISMRFLQAHYSAGDAFFAAMAPADFRLLWDARRNAADLAIRWEGGGRLGSEALKAEANAAYAGIQGMSARYTARPELQKLAAYFASVGEDYAGAVKHLRAARQQTTTDADILWMDQRIAELEADQSNVTGTVVAAAALGPETPTLSVSGTQQLSEAEQAILATPDFESLGYSAFARELAPQSPARKPVIALVLGGVDPFAPFGDRIVPATPNDGGGEGSIARHVEQVASVIATLAPHAQIKVYKALGPDGRANTTDVLSTLSRAIADQPDVVALALGPLGMAVSQIIDQSEALVIAAAGNSGTEPGLLFKGDKPFIYVGGSEGMAAAKFTNRGANVPLYAPATAVTFNRDGSGESRGTSFAAAVAAATAANFLIEFGDMPALDLKQRLLGSTLQGDGIAILSPTARNGD